MAPRKIQKLARGYPFHAGQPTISGITLSQRSHELAQSLFRGLDPIPGSLRFRFWVGAGSGLLGTLDERIDGPAKLPKRLLVLRREQVSSVQGALRRLMGETLRAPP